MVEHRLLSRPEAAEFLDVAPNTLTRMVKRGDIEAVQVGKRLKFEYAELVRYVALNRTSVTMFGAEPRLDDDS